MLSGVHKDRMMLRIAAPDHDAALAKAGVQAMDLTGRPMQGFLFLDDAAITDYEALIRWLKQAVSYVETAKPSKSRVRKK
jgi:hypothetical protein